MPSPTRVPTSAQFDDISLGLAYFSNHSCNIRVRLANRHVVGFSETGACGEIADDLCARAEKSWKESLVAQRRIIYTDLVVKNM